MEHSHSHGDHHHHHSHEIPSHQGRAFVLGITLNLIFVAVEVFYGLIANSSALLADAGHNVSDVLGLLFAWGAAWMATLKPKGKFTYGYRKTTILVSILNALFLFIAIAFIAVDAYKKLQNPEPISGNTVIIVAIVGIIINGITAYLFYKDQKKDLNIRGAFLHMIADALVSVGVVVSGVLINVTGLLWIDPVTSFVIILVIFFSSWRLFTASIDLALDAVPHNINYDEVASFLKSINGVEDIHDLHIWALSTSQAALSVHVHMPSGDTDALIHEIQEQLEEKFEIKHVTVQIEKLSTICHTDCH